METGIWFLLLLPVLHILLLQFFALGTPTATTIQLLRPIGTVGAALLLLYSSSLTTGRRRWSYLALVCSALSATIFSFLKITQNDAIDPVLRQLLWWGVYGFGIIGASLYLSQRLFWNGTTFRLIFDAIIVAFSTTIIIYTLMPYILPQWEWNRRLIGLLSSLSFDIGILFIIIVAISRYSVKNHPFLPLILLHTLCLFLADTLNLLTACIPNWQSFTGNMSPIYPLYTLQSVLLAYALYHDAKSPVQDLIEYTTRMPLRELVLWGFFPQMLLYTALFAANLSNTIAFNFLVITMIFATAHTILVIHDYHRVLQNVHNAEAHTAQSNAQLQTINQQLTDFNSLQSRIQFARAEESLAVVHDMRAELRHITTVLHQVRHQSDISPPTLTLLKRAEDSVQTLRTLASDMFDAAQLQQGRLVLSVQSTDILKLVTHVVSEYDTRYALQRCVLTMIVDGNIPCIPCDADRFARVVRNILENALRYTVSFRSDGVVEVLLTVESDAVILQICDNGIGIAASDLEILQQRITQLLTANKYPVENTGLGLTICARLMALHHGSFAIDSVGKGHGTTVTMRLPLP
ncbi:MAG: HAMP domain-containing sensor histidine kinase [Chloroflexota bacterium]